MAINKKLIVTIFVVVGVTVGVLGTQLGFYSIQPIGAIPDGATWLVWRAKSEPFFNSADRLCIDRLGGVSLLGRGMALGQAPKERIIVRMAYWKFAYLQSVGGTEIER
jgi:hypothetical protein